MNWISKKTIKYQPMQAIATYEKTKKVQIKCWHMPKEFLDKRGLSRRQ